MKYSIPGDYIYPADGDPTKGVLVVSEGDELPWKDFGLLLVGLLLVEGIVMHLTKNAFKAGAKAYCEGNLKALDSLGLLGPSADNSGN